MEYGCHPVAIFGIAPNQMILYLYYNYIAIVTALIFIVGISSSGW